MNFTILLTSNGFVGGSESEGMEPSYAQIYMDVYIFHLDFSYSIAEGLLEY